MVKVFVLLLIFFMALVSLGGYLFMNNKIAEGERQIAEGLKQIEKGAIELEDGKVRLEAGKLESSEGKKKYEQAEDNMFLVFMDDLFNAGKGFKKGRESISEGDKRVAQGVDNVNIGEKLLDAGKLKLILGREQVEVARGMRIVCGLVTIFFTFVTIALGGCWRRSLTRIFVLADA